MRKVLRGNLHLSIEIANSSLGILHPSIEIPNDSPEIDVTSQHSGYQGLDKEDERLKSQHGNVLKVEAYDLN